MEQPSGLRVSHEAIYTALYALPRGELRRELLSYLRQAKPVRGRKPKGSERRGKLCNMTNIKERPEEIEGRLVPGHWEGDLILGAGGASAVGTLVERTTRLVVLVHMPTRKAEVAASAFAGALNAIPAPLRKTLTYDQGKEMAGHAGLAAQTGMRIFFADPHSPWQRGANENTNGLLRQYLPKGSSLAGLDQSDLDLVAASLNDRPRKTLDYATPNEAFNSLLAKLVSGGKTSPIPSFFHRWYRRRERGFCRGFGSIRAGASRWARRVNEAGVWAMCGRSSASCMGLTCMPNGSTPWPAPRLG
jgi:IS30 family transposase